MLGILKNKNFWIGAIAGVITYQVILPRFAPGLKAKLPLS